MTAKILVQILVGASGSGKTTFAENAERVAIENEKDANHRSVIRLSADDYFVENGEYKFNPHKLGEAHASCMRKFASSLHEITWNAAFNYTLIVDNTNTTIVEIAPYYALAKAYNADVEIVRFERDPQYCAVENKHGVRRAAIDAMQDRISKTLIPQYWDVKITTRRH